MRLGGAGLEGCGGGGDWMGGVCWSVGLCFGYLRGGWGGVGNKEGGVGVVSVVVWECVGEVVSGNAGLV